MPVTINEIHSEVHAFDATALLNDEVMRVLVRRVAEELRRMEAEEKRRDRDKAVSAGRRTED